MSAPSVQGSAEGVYIKVKVQPRASRSKLGGVIGEELRISVTAPPVDSAANKALIEFLAELLQCPKGAVQIAKGHASRHKTVFLKGMTRDTVFRRLTCC